jgi:predicted nucleic-acid-binding protein
MTYGLDTSVIMRLLTSEPPGLAEKVRDFIEEHLTAGDIFFVSSLVASEAYFALQRHYCMSKEAVITAMRSLADEDGFIFSTEANIALGTPDAWKASPGFVDRMIANEYSAKGFSTISCEKDFRKLDFTEIIV